MNTKMDTETELPTIRWMPSEEKQQFWPPPDNAYVEPVLVEVEGAIVMRVETSEESGKVLFVTVLASGGTLVLHRFLLPNHTRFVRDFFKAAGVKKVPHNNDRFEINGLFPISFEGEVLGEDNIPEEIPKDQRPSKVFVMGNVDAHRLLDFAPN